MRPVASTNPEGTPTTLRLRRDPDAPQPPPIYANQVNVTFTPEDFTIHLGWYAIPALTEEPEGQIELQVEPVARVVLPLNLVRGVIAVLQKQIEAYEQSFNTTLPEHPNKPPWMLEKQTP